MTDPNQEEIARRKVRAFADRHNLEWGEDLVTPLHPYQLDDVVYSTWTSALNYLESTPRGLAADEAHMRLTGFVTLNDFVRQLGARIVDVGPAGISLFKEGEWLRVGDDAAWASREDLVRSINTSSHELGHGKCCYDDVIEACSAEETCAAEETGARLFESPAYQVRCGLDEFVVSANSVAEASRKFCEATGMSEEDISCIWREKFGIVV